MFFVPSFLQHLLLLLLFFAVDYSYSSPSNVNLRYERKTSSLTEFPRYGNFNLVLENGDDFLQFKMCCTNTYYGCHHGSLLFCFGAGKRFQGSPVLFNCGDGTCAYKIEYKADKTYELSGGIFETSDSCFRGTITNKRIYVSYSDGEKDDDGCVLDIDSENRLNLFIQKIPDDVTVTALNAKKYFPPTTTIVPSINITKSQKESDEGISDGLKYTLIGIGILLFVLILCGVGCCIYHCRKPKKTSEPAREVLEIKAEKPAEQMAVAKTEEPKESQKVKSKNETEGPKEVETIKAKTEAEEPKPSVPKRKKAKKMKKESKNRHLKKTAPTNIISSAEPAPSKEPIINPFAEQPKKVKKSKSKSKTKSDTVQYSPPFCLLPLPNEFPDHESQPIQRRGYRGGIRDSLQLEVQDSRQQPECYEGLRRKRRK